MIISNEMIVNPEIDHPMSETRLKNDKEADAASVTIDLAEFLPYRATRLAALLSQGLAAQYQQNFDISVAEWRVLVHLTQQSEISVRDIFDRVDMDRARVTRTVQNLQARGLVSKSRHPQDGRLLQLALTKDGQHLAAKLSVVAKAFAETAVRGLDAEAQKTLRTLIDHVEKNLQFTS